MNPMSLRPGRAGALLASPLRLLLAGFAAAILVLAIAAPTARAASEHVALDAFPMRKLHDNPALQDGVRTYVNYCLGCHGLALMRYNRLQDIGLTDEQIKASLIFDPAVKVGDPMKTSMRPEDAKVWFGALPPDLSLITRARSSASGSGSDWVYTYLRSFYRDSTRVTGWNNVIFPNVGMPHVLWHLQGERGATIEEVKPTLNAEGKVDGWAKTTITFDADGLKTEKKEPVHGHGHESSHVTLGPAQGGTMTQAQYDEAVANLTAFLTFVADPSAQHRTRVGVWVLMFLAVFVASAWWLNRVYWRDVK